MSTFRLYSVFQRCDSSSGDSRGARCRNDNINGNNDPVVAPETPGTLWHNSSFSPSSSLRLDWLGKLPWPTQLYPGVSQPNDPEPSPEVATIHTFINTGTVSLMATGTGAGWSSCHLQAEGRLSFASFIYIYIFFF